MFMAVVLTGWGTPQELWASLRKLARKNVSAQGSCYASTVGLLADIGHSNFPVNLAALAIADVRAQRGQIDKPPVDYVKLNKSAAKDGVVTPSQTAEYRKSHGCLVKFEKGGKLVTIKADGTKKVAVAGQALIQLKTKAKLPSDSNFAFVYGKPTRPSTPVAKLVSGVYARQPEDEHRDKGKKAGEVLQRRRPKIIAKLIQPACATTKKADTVGCSISPFKMKRFTQISPRVVTHRSKPVLQRNGEKTAAAAAVCAVAAVDPNEKNAPDHGKGTAAKVTIKERPERVQADFKGTGGGQLADKAGVAGVADKNPNMRETVVIKAPAGKECLTGQAEMFERIVSV